MKKIILTVILIILLSLHLYEPDTSKLCAKCRDYIVSIYNKTMPQSNIDIVYTWVNGNDPEWQKEKSKYEKTDGKLSPDKHKSRYVDNQELKYALRSLEKNAPWVHNIYIVTNGQIPEWLDTTHPKIKIITHKEIMPASALPTFNSEAIEANIANIENLSEYFLYSNDDFFIGRPITPKYFFTKDKKPVIRLVDAGGTPTGLYRVNIKYSSDLIKEKYGKSYDKYLSSHNVMPYRKSYYKHCANEFKKDFDRTTHSKFRMKNSIQRSIVSFYTLSQNLGIYKPAYDNLYTSLLSPEELSTKLKDGNPMLFCINDFGDAEDKDREQLKDFLETLFPKKAPWEK